MKAIPVVNCLDKAWCVYPTRLKVVTTCLNKHTGQSLLNAIVIWGLTNIPDKQSIVLEQLASYYSVAAQSNEGLTSAECIEV